MSRLLLPTLFEDPKEGESISHRLMLRAGIIRPLAAGIYSFLPLGNRVLNKIIAIIREEMDRIGAQEVLLPALHPKELWEETGRWEAYGDDMFRLRDRRGREFGLGPTHEEVITDIVRKTIRSYRDLPKMLYQIQTKFRDEVRPRFGIMRGREFIMKDAYTFARSIEEVEEDYKRAYGAYCRIFERLGLRFCAVEADPGLIGGSSSHEFMVMAESGEDIVVKCEGCGYAANLEQAEIGDGKPEEEGMKVLELKETPGMKTVREVSSFLSVPPSKLIKTLLYTYKEEVAAALVPGDRELNETKLRRHLGWEGLEMATSEVVERVSGCEVGFSGPIGLEGIKIVADQSISQGVNFVVGANREDFHYMNANPGRDFKADVFCDIKVARDGDPCRRCGGRLKLSRGIEVGHVFMLGERYSEKMGATFTDEDGVERLIMMGCYGIGVTRLIAAIIEQNHDKKGIVWPLSIAPYHVVILLLDPSDPLLRKASEEVYELLQSSKIDVLLDDRDISPGKKFNDSDLIGIPIHLIIGKRMKEEGKIEISLRGGGDLFVTKQELVDRIESLLGAGGGGRTLTGQSPSGF